VRQVAIGGKRCGEGEPVFIVFEAGPTLLGFESARHLVNLAAEAGADAIKFQILDTDRLVGQKGIEITYKVLKGEDGTGTEEVTEPLETILKRRELSRVEWAELKRHADTLGITFFATVDYPETLKFVLELGCHAVKVASGDVNHHPWLEKVARSGIPVMLDTGSSTIGEIERAVEIITAAGNENIIIHHCPSGYPARLESINLRVLTTLRQMFEFPIAFCVAPDSRVVTTDLRWVKASELVVGDRLIGFDEQLAKGRRIAKMRYAMVEAISYPVLPCYRIVTDRGTVVASSEHKWVVTRYNSSQGCPWRSWVRTEDMRVGDKLTIFSEPWEEENSWEAGWLAGFFDGEGYFSGKNLRGNGGQRVCVGQNPGDLLDYAKRLLSERGYRFGEYTVKNAKYRKSEYKNLYLLGREQTLRFLGSIRPRRLLARADEVWLNTKSFWPGCGANIIAIEPLGLTPTVGVKTNTGTMIVEGFLSHNSDHTPGWDMDIAAVALGATMVEKTLTLDRRTRSAEHMMSVEPSEASAFVRAIRDLEVALGRPRRVMTAEEARTKLKARRSLFLTRDVRKGERLTEDLVDWRRPGTGIVPGEIRHALGRTFSRDLPGGVIVSWNDLV